MSAHLTKNNSSVIRPLTLADIRQRYASGEKIVMLTAYDYPFARLVDQAGTHLILIGDSLGTVVQGLSTTLPVTLDEMIYHCRLVVRGVQRSIVIADMPFMSFQLGPKEALQAAGRLVKESGVSAVKIEGGISQCDVVREIVGAGIPVMGHIGLRPQAVHHLGGYRVQGKTKEGAEQIIVDARALCAAGAFAIVLECIPSGLAQRVTKEINIPTIGIGAGVHCSGQVLVLHDLLGLSSLPGERVPKFVRRYAELSKETLEAVQAYVKDVEEGKFPSDEFSYD